MANAVIENTEEPTNDIYEEGSLSADLAAAFDDMTTEDTTDGERTIPLDNTTGEHDPDPGESTTRQPAADASGVPGSEKPETAPVTEESAPVSLPPDAREVWKDTPAAMKAAIAKREKDYEAGIVKYAQNARRAEQMDGVLGQYQQYFATTGEPIGNTINTLLRTASSLHMAPPIQKAQIIAGLIGQYGVPIDVLDNLLAGENVPHGTQQTDAIDQRIQQAVAPFQTLLQQMERQKVRERQQQQQQQARIATELQQFAAKNEFYNDVSMDMAKELDEASRREVPMSLDEAYDRACWTDPKIRQIRLARDRAPTPGQQRAASTLQGTPGGPGSQQEPDDLQSAIRAAWDTQGRL
jgi:hypothetical protein